MVGKTHKDIRTIRPLKDGVIADFDAAEHMIRGMIRMINPGPRLFQPSLKMVICIPSGITEVEKRAVRDSAEHAGAKEVYLIHEPMAAAIGIGIDVEEPMGNMIIDIGGGTSEIAVIALGGIVCDQSIRVAGDVFTNDIWDYMRRQHNIMIGERSAEQIKIQVGSALPELENPPSDFAVHGRDLMTGIRPRTPPSSGSCVVKGRRFRPTTCGSRRSCSNTASSCTPATRISITWRRFRACDAVPAGDQSTARRRWRNQIASASTPSRPSATDSVVRTSSSGVPSKSWSLSAINTRAACAATRLLPSTKG